MTALWVRVKTRGKSPRPLLATIAGYGQPPARPCIPAHRTARSMPGGRLHQIDDRDSQEYRIRLTGPPFFKKIMVFSEQFGMIFVKLFKNS